MHIAQDGLNAQMQTFLAGFMQRLTPPDRQAILDAAAAVKAAKDGDTLLREGDIAPDFTLPDQHGRPTRLYEQLQYGPVGIMFVRGGWCPVCTLALRAYQAALPAIHDLGGSLFAVTPQPPDRCSTMAERDLLAFPTLSDRNNEVAARYGIVYDLPEMLRPVYLRLGHDLPHVNKTGDWRLPLPATYLVDRGGRIVVADAPPTIYHRLEPATLIAALQGLRVDA